MPDVRNVFISHIHEDDRHLDGLKGLMADRGLDIRDSSVNAATPNKAKDEGYIKSQILAPKIQWAGTIELLPTALVKHNRTQLKDFSELSDQLLREWLGVVYQQDGAAEGV